MTCPRCFRGGSRFEASEAPSWASLALHLLSPPIVRLSAIETWRPARHSWLQCSVISGRAVAPQSSFSMAGSLCLRRVVFLLAGSRDRSEKRPLETFPTHPFGMAARHSGAKWPFAGVLPAVRLPSAASRHRETKISFAHEPHPFLPTTASAAPSKGCSYLQTFFFLSCFCLFLPPEQR